MASAIAGHALQVTPGHPGEPAWTDGRSVFVDPDADTRRQIESVAVQASLLAAGSLAPDLLPPLARRPALARRYLALEGHRALAAMADVLPPSLRSLIDPGIAASADSPAASLDAARAGRAPADAPECFGALRARRLLRTLDRVARSKRSRAAADQAPRPRPEPVLAELAEDDVEEGSDAFAAFSSPGGRGGALGRLFARMLRPVRQLTGGAPSGPEAATHGMPRAARRARVTSISSAGPVAAEGSVFAARGAKYPEWDLERRRYRPDWCTVLEVEPRPEATTAPAPSDPYGLRRPLARLGMGLDRYHRQSSGDDIDIDAAIEARVEALAGSAPDEAFYIDSLRLRRDLSVLVLLDVSGSSAEPAAAGAAGETVHEQQRAVASALLTALHDVGDRVALYAFRSQGRSAVHWIPVKRFEESLDAAALRRLHGLVPGMYSRLGAAIRHGSTVVSEQGGTSRRLLVVLSDGLAYDHGYEPAYGAADSRRALGETRRRGVGCLCLGIGNSTDAAALRRVFGSTAFASIPIPEQLGQVVGPLFRSALRSAEISRQMGGLA